MPITNKSAEAAKPKEREYLLSDRDGLYLRVRPSGAKSWVYKYRRPFDGKQAKVTIGGYPACSLRDARKQARDYRNMLDEGVDPHSVKAAKKEANSKAVNLQYLFDTWMEHIRVSGIRSDKWLRKQEGRWNRYLGRPLAGILVKDVHRAHLSSALDAMTLKGIKEETRQCLTLLNSMLDYGVNRHYLEVNPARLLKPKDFAASAGSARDRVMDLGELRALWVAIEKAQEPREGLSTSVILSESIGAAIKILVCTGARRAEVAGMRPDELDLNAGEWHIPKERTKNRKGHTVHLAPVAIDLIREQIAQQESPEYVFPSPEDAGRSIHPDSLTKAVWRLRQLPDGHKEQKAHPLFKVEPFTLHDIRRSAATAWGEHLKTPPHIIELMLNHLPKDKLVATYQRATYQTEQREAWLQWGELINKFIANEPENVVPIRGKRKSNRA